MATNVLVLLLHFRSGLPETDLPGLTGFPCTGSATAALVVLIETLNFLARGMSSSSQITMFLLLLLLFVASVSTFSASVLFLEASCSDGEGGGRGSEGFFCFRSGLSETDLTRVFSFFEGP